MIERAVRAAGQLHPRLVLVLIPLILAFVALEGWVLVLRKPYGEYRKVVDNRAALAAALHQAPDRSGELAALASQLKQLSDQLGGELRLPASDDRMTASLMAALDQSAASHGIVLSGVKPGERNQVSVFEEISFEIGARGAYVPLCNWMQDFGKTLGNNVTITEFAMKSADDGRQVALTLKIALYRPLKPGEAVR